MTPIEYKNSTSTLISSDIQSPRLHNSYPIYGFSISSAFERYSGFNFADQAVLRSKLNSLAIGLKHRLAENSENEYFYREILVQ